MNAGKDKTPSKKILTKDVKESIKLEDVNKSKLFGDSVTELNKVSNDKEDQSYDSTELFKTCNRSIFFNKSLLPSSESVPNPEMTPNTGILKVSDRSSVCFDSSTPKIDIDKNVKTDWTELGARPKVFRAVPQFNSNATPQLTPPCATDWPSISLVKKVIFIINKVLLYIIKIIIFYFCPSFLNRIKTISTLS